SRPAVAVGDQNSPAAQPNLSNTSIPAIPLSRRSMLAALGASCSGLLAPSVLAAVSQGYVRKTDANNPGANSPGANNPSTNNKSSKGQILSASQLQTLSAMVEVIIPAGDTPGAAATDTHGFIDDQLAHCHANADAKEFIANLDKVSKIIAAHWGKPYEQLSTTQQNKAMKAMAEAAAPFSETHGEYFHHLKRLTVFGYYSSEVGMTQELVYLPIPGGYDAKFKLPDNEGKAFSLFSY
ncbi:MAG: gluconate 2-dehydrogenase subunit 3 family protein, partial [Cellvibrionaceae bacterium]|nr:gluconate 2-dehydrogenase subunit 3 family protein [Cellvibrionaceae bacterium]